MARSARNGRTQRRLRILVTAGPTREHVDPVRYLSNESSGRMGFAIADAAARAGHAVTLIAGPVALATPPNVRRVDVVSARELLNVARRAFRTCDVLVMAAAVADWRPARRLSAKWRAKDSGAERTELALVRNPDVLATLTRGRRTRGKVVIAFALETGAGEARAKRKLAAKGADWIVLNGPAALGGERTSIVILGADGSRTELRNRTKRAAAEALVTLAVQRVG
jgi:phosphopantothenoylcysteine decarboxylase/phosphopantothenate--cysteine ligase